MQTIPHASNCEVVLFVAKDVGLANRLRALAGYHAVARLIERPFLLRWQADIACNSAFLDLFDSPAFSLVSASKARDLMNRPGVWAVTEPSWFHVIHQRYASHTPWLEFLAVVSDSMCQLHPAPAIQEAVASMITNHPISEAVGVHIRHTDNVDLQRAWSQFDPEFDLASASTPEGFRRVIRSCISTAPVFLATDSVAVERTLRREFGGLITFPKTYKSEWRSCSDTKRALSTARTTTEADALAEMLLLSSCRRIVGSYFSSFSELSAVWGRVDYCEVRGIHTDRNPRVESTVAELKAIAPSANHQFRTRGAS